jgi:hypothetical protein
MSKPIENIQDSFELKISKRECKELKDSVQTGKNLIVKVKATHGGYINGNRFNYAIDSMQDTTKTWITPYGKPVLVHHDEMSDPIGRVMDAEFQPITTNRKDKPKGVIVLTLKVTDQNAIEKILDGRYMTVSVGSSPASAVCSICDRDVAKFGPCNHKRGTEYDDKLCYWTVNVKKYNEVSFVNMPADEYQKGIESADLKDKDGTEDAINFEVDSNKAEFYLEDAEKSKTEEPEMQKEEKIIINPENVDGTYTQDDLDMVQWLLDELYNEPELADKKLSTEARKKLSSNVFCGPDRSFPVNDCAHYTAAKRLIGRYKGPGDKSRILACVERRGKQLSCPSTKTKDDNIMELKQEDFDKLQKDLTETKTKLETIQKDLTTADTLKKTLENQITDKNKEIETLNDQVIKFKAINHEILVDKIYTLRVKLGKEDIKDLKDETLTAYKATLAKRTHESLNDCLVDLESELKVKEQVKPNEPIEKVNKDSIDKKDEKQTTTVDKKEVADTTNIRDLSDILKDKVKK